MTQPRTDDCSFCGTEWVHVFEKDSGAGALFKPAGTDIPLSRRPRERLVLHTDGSAVMRTGAPDDRLSERQARWSREGQDIVIRDTDGKSTWRIVDHSADRLLVRMN